MNIYGTLGPACTQVDTLEKMLEAGLTGMRLNLSHCSIEEAAPMIEAFHKAQLNLGVKAELLIDMQGPELRIGAVTEPIKLSDGQIFILGAGGVSVPEQVLTHLNPGQELLLDDGKIMARVTEKQAEGAMAEVLRGGILTGRKSICLCGVSIEGPSLTDMDVQNIKKARSYGVTWLMQPFVRHRHELDTVRRTLDENGCGDVRIMAKIESLEGVDNIGELIPACDEICIARGDLGNAMPLWKLPAVQKALSRACLEAGRDFTVVTQMLYTMEKSPVPTRAEMSDIFNAVLDGASSLMLTGETAVGLYPVEAVRYMSAAARSALDYMRD